MKFFILLVFSFLHLTVAKNYYLLNDEETNSAYVYSLFGLNARRPFGNDIIDKLFGKSDKRRPPSVSSPTDVSALTNITMCYYLGDDVEKSHLQFNDQWKFTQSNLGGLYTYINQLTLGTNILLGLHNYKLKWKGPYARSDKQNRYPERLAEDTLTASQANCDVVVFLVFNDYTVTSETAGHKYSGFAVGGPCEAAQKSGYTVIVDQGFYGDIWMGPQILAHHLLLMLTSDLYQAEDPRRYCDNPKSLLHKYIKAGQQSIDQCVVDKLNQSNISIRSCLLDA